MCCCQSKQRDTRARMKNAKLPHILRVFFEQVLIIFGNSFTKRRRAYLTSCGRRCVRAALRALRGSAGCARAGTYTHPDLEAPDSLTPMLFAHSADLSGL